MSDLTFVGLPAERNARLTIVPGKRRAPPEWARLSAEDLADVRAVYLAESRDQGNAVRLRDHCREVAKLAQRAWLRKLLPVSAMKKRGILCRREWTGFDESRFAVREWMSPGWGDLIGDTRSRHKSAAEAWDEARETIARLDGLLT